MLDGPAVAAALVQCGVTHIVWIPDSELGTWEAALLASPSLALVRVCREGEAFAVAAGLQLGGKKPIIILQCTGLFEAGDALRNVLHDLKLPLFMIIGIRSYFAHSKSASTDTCPVFAEPIVAAWQIPYQIFDESKTGQDLVDAITRADSEKRAAAVLLAE